MIIPAELGMGSYASLFCVRSAPDPTLNSGYGGDGFKLVRKCEGEERADQQHDDTR